jgi:hypothetical protein
VLLPTNFLYATQFVQQADSQGWRPKYAGTDLEGISADDLVKNMPASFDGALATTANRSVFEAREGYPEPPTERACRETFNRVTGANWTYGQTGPYADACWQVHLFEAIAKEAGPNLTRAGWTAAAQRLGSFPMAGLFGGSLSAGKFDYADQIRTLRWSYACKCYKIADQPHRVRF